MFYLSLICVLTVIVHIGYIENPAIARYSEQAIYVMFYTLFFCEAVRTFSSIFASEKFTFAHYSGLIVIAYFTVIMLFRLLDNNLGVLWSQHELIYHVIGIVILSELSKRSLFFDNFYFNPTILFAISFIALILVGTVLLMLPRATVYSSLTFIEALFMATSAVCITGLSVTNKIGRAHVC